MHLGATDDDDDGGGDEGWCSIVYHSQPEPRSPGAAGILRYGCAVV